MSHTEKSRRLSGCFWDSARIGRLMIPQCDTCQQWQWPVTDRCRRCRGQLGWQAATGRGVLLSWSTVLRAPRPELQPLVPYVVAFVRLEEGVRIMTHLKDPQGLGLAVDRPVICSFETLHGENGTIELPIFSIVEG
ncbi:MAG: Zn-ribbon domain-containing OB-fold protein [Advenella sp.]